MTELGSTITVAVDPDRNGGFDTAPAIITGVYEDGSLRVRVLGATGDQDTTRNYVDDQGEPFDAERYAAQHAQSEPATDAGTPTSSPSTSDTAGDTAGAPQATS